MKGIPAYIILLVLGTQITSETSLAQPVNDSILLNSNLFREKLHLFTDRTLYASGETVYFRLYNLSHELLKENNWSRVLYLELISSQKNPVVQAKYSMELGDSQGYIVIPDTVPTGLYDLRAYTRWMRNFPASEYFHLPLVIVNPDKISRSGFSDSITEKKDGRIVNNQESGIVCTPDKTNYGKREKVTVRFRNADGPPPENSYCVSVTRSGYLDERFNYLPDHGGMKIEDGTGMYLPDSRGITFSGQLLTKEDGRPAGASRMAMTLLGPEPDYIEIRSDESGRINFVFPRHTGDVDALITFYSRGSAPKEIRLDSEFSTDYSGAPFTGTDFFNERRDLVEEALVISQLRTAFQLNSVDTLGAENGVAAYPFYGDPEFRYKSEDYVELPNLAEFFFEIIRQVRVKSDREGNGFTVIDMRGEDLPYAPLILLDNVPVMETDNLLSISPAEIEYIDVVNRVYIRGSYVYGGIVSIKSKNKDRAGIGLPPGSIFINFGTLYSREESHLPAIAAAESGDRIPDLRTTLYWSGRMDIGNAKADQISFYTSDIPGDYRVCVRGITSDGKFIRGTCEFRVR